MMAAAVGSDEGDKSVVDGAPQAKERDAAMEMMCRRSIASGQRVVVVVVDTEMEGQRENLADVFDFSRQFCQELESLTRLFLRPSVLSLSWMTTDSSSASAIAQKVPGERCRFHISTLF